MSSSVITVTPDTPIEQAARIMVDNKIGGLPVVNESNAVAGIITETDIFKALAEVLGGLNRTRCLEWAEQARTLALPHSAEDVADIAIATTM